VEEVSMEQSEVGDLPLPGLLHKLVLDRVSIQGTHCLLMHLEVQVTSGCFLIPQQRLWQSLQ
jgi:hypothetical protein